MENQTYFLDQNIDTINEFDKLTQKKIKKIKDKNIIINPSSELLLNDYNDSSTVQLDSNTNSIASLTEKYTALKKKCKLFRY